MGYTNLNSYNSTECASLCNAITGCIAINLYFERDPSLDPNAVSCPNPPSITNIKYVTIFSYCDIGVSQTCLLSYSCWFAPRHAVEYSASCNPEASYTNFSRCVFWGAPISAATATNEGQYRDSFEVVIAGEHIVTKCYDMHMLMSSRIERLQYDSSSSISARFHWTNEEGWSSKLPLRSN